MKTMKKIVFLCTCAVVTILFCDCGNSKMTVSTSTRVDLAHSIYYLPSLADVSVQTERVTATATIAELEGLNKEQMNQAVVARAVANAKADVLIAPRFSTEKGADGKIVSLTVVGYPAMIVSIRTLTEQDTPFFEQKEIKQELLNSRISVNTLTVAEVTYNAKRTLTLASNELVGKKEADALKLAKEKLLRDEKADFLYEPQYTATILNGMVSSLTLTAFPARYTNYHPTTIEEVQNLQPTPQPVIYYNTTADIQPVAERIQKKYGTGSSNATINDIKETAREAVLKKYNADFLLNEQFYFDYSDKVITHVTICGTPAVYANFRPLQPGEMIDTKLVPIAGSGSESAEEPKQKSLLDTILGIFKK